MLEKPPLIENDPFKSAKWDELTKDRNFNESDIPTLILLIQWHYVVQRCIEDIDETGGQVAYQNELGDLKAFPQLSTMKQASAEIRALNKQLGINDEHPLESTKETKVTVLNVIQGKRARRAAGAAT